MKKLLLLLLLSCIPAHADLYSEILLSLDVTDARGAGIIDHQQFREYRQLPNGTNATYPQADLVWHGERNLASGASETLDLRGGLTDTFGDACSFVHLRGLMAVNTGTTTITLSGAPLGPLSSVFSIATGGILLPGSASILLSNPITGYNITSDTADLLGVNNAFGGTGTYKILLLGNSL